MAFWRNRRKGAPSSRSVPEQERVAELHRWEHILDDLWFDGSSDAIYDYWVVRNVAISTAWAVEVERAAAPIVTFSATFMDDERHPDASYEVAAVSIAGDGGAAPDVAIEPTAKRRLIGNTLGEVVVVARKGTVLAGRCCHVRSHPPQSLPANDSTAPVSELIDELRRHGIAVRER